MKTKKPLKERLRGYINKKFFFGRGDAILPSGDDLAGLYNPYYAKLSRIFNLASLASSSLLVLFVLGAVLLNIGSLTYENLYYFVKDFDALVASGGDAAPSVLYSREDNRTYAEYKGGFVTAGRASLSVYSATGRKTKSYYGEYKNPVLRGCSKYFLVYDIGDSRISLYNSFARLRRLEFDRPILAAEICEDGGFAVLTTHNLYKSVIYRYNSSFELVSVYNLKNYVTAMSLDPGGKYLILAYADAGGDSLASGIRIYDDKSEEPVFESRVEGLILGCGMGRTQAFSDNIPYYYVCGDLLAAGGSVTGETRVELREGVRLIGYSADNSGLAATAADGGNYLLYHLPFAGESVGIPLECRPTALKKRGKEVYLLCGDTLTRYNLSAGTFRSRLLSPEAEDIIISESGYIFICYPSGAESIRF